MKRVILFFVLFVLMLSVQVCAYTYDNDGLYCTSCSDCTDAINNVTYNTTYLNATITDYVEICISNPTNISNVVFDCQGYTMNGDDVSDDDDGAFYINNKQNVTIRNCVLTDSDAAGVGIISSSNISLINNTISLTDNGYGVSLSSSSNITMANNTFYDNEASLYISGTTESHYDHDIDTSNTVEGDFIYYLYNESDTTIDGSSSQIGFLVAFYSNNLSITDLNITGNDQIYFKNVYNSTLENSVSSNHNNAYGLYLENSSNNVFSNNVFNSNNDGLYVYLDSDNNTFIGNTLSSNTRYGIQLHQNSDNNTFTSNTINSSGNSPIYLGSYCLNNTFTDNTGDENGQSITIIYTSTGTTFSGNSIQNEYDDETELFNRDGSVLIEINQTGSKIGYKLLWKKKASGNFDEYCSPIVPNGVLYIGSKSRGLLFGLNELTGEHIWNFSTGLIDDTPTHANDVLYVSSYDPSRNKTYALDADDGSLIWNFTMSFGGGGSPAFWNDIVYVNTRDNVLYALNSSSESMTDAQRELWNYTGCNGTEYGSSPTVVDGVLYAGCVGSLGGNKIFAMNATNGLSIWNSTIATAGVWDSSPVIYGDKLYVGTTDPSAKLFSLNKTDGSEFWNYSLSGDQLSPISVDDDMIFASGDHVMYAINDTTGALVWSYDTGASVYGSALAGDILYVTSRSYKIYAFNKTDGDVLWTYTLGDDLFSQPAVANGKLFFNADDWYFRVFDIGDGNGNWTTFGHNQSRNAVTDDGLTTHRYVEADCNVSGSTITCNVTNNYDETIYNIVLDNTNNISYAKVNDQHVIDIYDDKIFLPALGAGETISVEFANGTYNSSIPKIITATGSRSVDNFDWTYLPNYLDILNSTYDEATNITSIRINGTGTNTNVTINYTLLDDFDVFDSYYGTQPIAEIRSGSVSETRGSYQVSYTSPILMIIIPTMSEHTIEIKPDAPIRSNGEPTGTINTRTTTLSLMTDRNSTCKYSNTADISYSSMTSTNSDWGTDHSWTIDISQDGTYTYYVKCNSTDGSYNTDDYEISFTVSTASPGGGTPYSPPEPEEETQPIETTTTPLETEDNQTTMGEAGAYETPLGSGGSYFIPLEGVGTYVIPLGGGGSYFIPLGGGSHYIVPLGGGSHYSMPDGTYVSLGGGSHYIVPLGGGSHYAVPLGGGTYVIPLGGGGSYLSLGDGTYLTLGGGGTYVSIGGGGTYVIPGLSPLIKTIVATLFSA